MKHLILALFLLMPVVGRAAALAAPTGLVGGPVVNYAATVDWNEDTAVSQWNIYVGGVFRYQPLRSDTTVPATGKRRYLMTGLPPQQNVVITMRALAAGQTISAESAALTITAYTVPVTYVLNAPGTSLSTSGTGGTGSSGTVTITASGMSPSGTPLFVSPIAAALFGGASQTNVSLNAGTSYVGAINISNTAAAPANVTFTSSPVTGGSGNVDPTTQRVVVAVDAPYIGVSITSAVSTPISLTAGTAFIGSISMTAAALHPVSLSAGTAFIGSISMTAAALHPVSLSAGTAFIGAVSVTAGTAIGVTLGAIVATLKTAGTGVDGLNTSITFDYDVNSKTANSRRGLDHNVTYLATSGTTVVAASGYTLLYSLTILPASVTNSSVWIFDRANTKVAVSANTAYNYVWPRGIPCTAGMSVGVSSTAAFDGVAVLGWTQ